MRLKTDYDVGKIPHSEYPRPQLRRENWLCLNGEWSFVKVKQAEEVSVFSEKILVPFSPETLNSGIAEGFKLNDDEKLVYEREVFLDENLLKGVTLLHFGAVDQECEVFFNGVSVCKHKGGYTPFSADITETAKLGKNVLRVECVDYIEKSSGARGKQSSTPKEIWYTPQSGIWQTVWLESAPKEYIQDLRIYTNAKDLWITSRNLI